MAFILVPHLDPNYESQMAVLLSKVSSIPVVEAEQGMIVETNHVYVIPPKKFMTIEGGALQLSEPPNPQGREIAIDYFLRSLAKDQGEHSVGIVLSGTGSHGTLGIRDIKLAGGMAIAQQPRSAEFDSMPSSIIVEGMADYVLLPEEMPATLLRYMGQPYLKRNQQQKHDASTEIEQHAVIVQQLRKHTKYDFGNYRKNMIQRRVQRRMGLHQLESLQKYVDWLKDDPIEARALYRDLLISVTAFFRDPEAYAALREHLTPWLKNRDNSSFPVRVWVAGCATGEEAYSLAILLLECLDERPDDKTEWLGTRKRIHVFASDVDEAAIAVARAGVYPSSIATDVSQDRLERFFTRIETGQYRIGQQLRESIVFSQQNLIDDPPFSRLDIISCRNLLIYLEPEVQQRIIALFHFALVETGVLMLGPSESISQSAQLFEPISKKWRILKKLPSTRRNRLLFPLVGMRDKPAHSETQEPFHVLRHGHKELVERALINLYAPATALVNRRYEVLYVTGPLVEYLEFPTGEPSHNLLSMCRPGLRTKLRFVCQKSIAENIDASVTTQMKRGEVMIDCTIHVRLLRSRPESELMLLISFTDTSHDKALPIPTSKPLPKHKTTTYSEQLEQELRANSEELGDVIDELEGANEDLKTSNEEIMSMNEELQSANEELETSKEELQSLNEELSTVNLELLDKISELDIAKNEILNLLASTEIATLFLDADLLIQRFTPPTAMLLNVRSTDIGRPLGDITTRFVDHSFVSDCRQVLQDAIPIESELAGEQSRMYLRRILPYRSHGNQVIGVVVTFIDLTVRLSLEKSLKESKDHLETILDSAVDAILTVDDQGFIARINPSMETLFGHTRDDILGKHLLSLFTPPSSDRILQGPLVETLPLTQFGSGNYLDLKAKRKDGTNFDAELTLNRVEHLSLYIVIIRDVTQRKHLEKRILEIASDEQRRIGQELHDGTQQELTGLSLIAGTIENSLIQKATLAAQQPPQGEITLSADELSRLIASVSKLVQGIDKANRHVQSLSHGIMPVQIDAQGLCSALAELAHETTVEDQIDCSFAHSGPKAIDSNDVATHLFRIAQEAINNALRHGEAKTIEISLTTDQQQIILEICDDGDGLPASPRRAANKDNPGVGLQIMEYRASVIGGRLSIVPGEDRGVTVRCTVPRTGRFL